MLKKRILKLIRKLNLDNPLEFTRELVAPLCKEKLDKHITNCNDCKTCKNYEKRLSIGNPNANYLIINDNATDDEAVNEYLNSLLEAAGIPMNDVYIINSISCILKRTFDDEVIIRLPNRNEVKNCKYFVDYSLDFVNPRVVICMGTTSLAMYRNDITIEEVKGQFIDIKGFKAMVTNSAKDLFTMSQHYSEEEMETIVNNVVEDIATAKQYVDNLRRR